MTDNSGGLLTRYTYDPYGQSSAVYVSGTHDSTFRYTGNYLHETSSLYATTGDGDGNAGRFYDAQKRSWLNRDGYGEEGGLNLYGYVLDNPLNWLDTNGLFPRSTVGGGDPGFSDPRATINQLKEQLQNSKLSQREKSQIKRRIKELSRQLSKKAHGADTKCNARPNPVPPENPTPPAPEPPAPPAPEGPAPKPAPEPESMEPSGLSPVPYNGPGGEDPPGGGGGGGGPGDIFISMMNNECE